MYLAVDRRRDLRFCVFPPHSIRFAEEGKRPGGFYFTQTSGENCVPAELFQDEPELHVSGRADAHPEVNILLH